MTPWPSSIVPCFSRCQRSSRSPRQSMLVTTAKWRHGSSPVSRSRWRDRTRMAMVRKGTVPFLLLRVQAGMNCSTAGHDLGPLALLVLRGSRVQARGGLPLGFVDGLDLGGQRLAHVGGNSKLDASFVRPGQPILIVQRRVRPQPPRGQAHGQRAEGGLKEATDGVRGRHVAVAELITTPLWSSRRLAQPKAPSAAEPPGIPRSSATPRPCATR